MWRKIFITIASSKYSVNEKRLTAVVQEILTAVRRKGCGLNLIFVNDQSMIAHNRRVFGKNRSTDVISFPWQLPLRKGPI